MVCGREKSLWNNWWLWFYDEFLKFCLRGYKDFYFYEFFLLVFSCYMCLCWERVNYYYDGEWEKFGVYERFD